MLLFPFLFVAAMAVLPQGQNRPGSGDPIPGQPYYRYETKDALARRVTFYVSEPDARHAKRPLLVYVQGSSTASHFVKAGAGIRGMHGHSAIFDEARGRTRVLLIEKPGVEYLSNPSRPDAVGGGASFRAEHTLDRWVEAIRAAIYSARTLEGVDTSLLLVAGHSEGGLVAAALAARLSMVTHVAVLAGGGPTQLYDLIEHARRGIFFTRISADPEERVEHVIASWQRIQRHPSAADSVWFGHSFRRWSSFLATSTLEQLTTTTKAAIYVAQGTSDNAVSLNSFDVLHAHLLAHGKVAVADRVEGADHSFNDASGNGGWNALWRRIIDWAFPT